ncbi:MAG: thioesterase family protein [Meiothermus sp.]|uniref:thioesterase family protein n=1 Tax=Meiothermus sp. TaxID=1955249 RepID=UPI0025E15C8C|nr:thioesterase family protein [Meiothermus sp.]MCS7059164.1 thioesterase family protein [Meiothermus sp.]MCS7194860.1 thioesterase family protein [Meiothermus sp.]MCX7741225.1 thioesterase family protein [Meiothermus sp.]MDW8090392.1 thioesterase family protein [Meiothermus sp.]MDW8481106.1 thioesterase family protein [Meiothermus sp.]
MKPIPIGYQAIFETVVTDEMTVDFEQGDPQLGKLHPVYATYWMAKHMELAGRKIILPFLEENEEGIGSKVSVDHQASALPGMRVRIVAEHLRTEGNRVHARCTAWNELGDRIGEGYTEQVILPKEKLRRIFERLEVRWREHRADSAANSG